MQRLSQIDDLKRAVASLNKFYCLPTVVTARWTAVRAAATRGSTFRRLRREMGILRETLEDICEPGDCASQPHTRAQINRRIDELKVI